MMEQQIIRGCIYQNILVFGYGDLTSQNSVCVLYLALDLIQCGEYVTFLSYIAPLTNIIQKVELVKSRLKITWLKEFNGTVCLIMFDFTFFDV